MPNSERPRRGAGRPKKNQPRAFASDELDRLLVHGEPGPDGAVSYPSFRELAARLGISHSTVADYARAHDCLGRRNQAQGEARELADRKFIERRAEDLAVEKTDLMRTLDRYFVGFERALVEGRVRCDNPADFNLMCRLRAFLLGDADSRHEIIRGTSAEELQAKYNRTQEIEATLDADPELGGMNPN